MNCLAHGHPPEQEADPRLVKAQKTLTPWQPLLCSVAPCRPPSKGYSRNKGQTMIFLWAQQTSELLSVTHTHHRLSREKPKATAHGGRGKEQAQRQGPQHSNPHAAPLVEPAGPPCPSASALPAELLQPLPRCLSSRRPGPGSGTVKEEGRAHRRAVHGSQKHPIKAGAGPQWEPGRP